LVLLQLDEADRANYVPHGQAAVHTGYNCDACGVKPIVGARYRKQNANFDLCEADFQKVSHCPSQLLNDWRWLICPVSITGWLIVLLKD